MLRRNTRPRKGPRAPRRIEKRGAAASGADTMSADPAGNMNNA
tara:strand:+ start:10100 stop:10228 length:129 start_codon:yes stop_codon:yes gene_type:complete